MEQKNHNPEAKTEATQRGYFSLQKEQLLETGKFSIRIEKGQFDGIGE